MDAKSRQGPRVDRRTVPELLTGPQWTALVDALQLSARERDILRCMFSDEHVATISQRLGIDEGTVHTYRERLFRKVGVRTCAQLLAAAFATYLELNFAPPLKS